MAKLITKFKYLKPSARQSVGGYAKYIATREGVEKVDDTFKNDPPTEKQKKLIDKILRDFPDSKDMLRQGLRRYNLFKPADGGAGCVRSIQ